MSGLDIEGALLAHEPLTDYDGDIAECRCGQWGGGETWQAHAAAALRAQIDAAKPRLRAEVQDNGARPATAQVWLDDVMIFDGIALSALTTTPPPNPSTTEGEL